MQDLVDTGDPLIPAGRDGFLNLHEKPVRRRDTILIVVISVWEVVKGIDESFHSGDINPAQDWGDEVLEADCRWES